MHTAVRLLSALLCFSAAASSTRAADLAAPAAAEGSESSPTHLKFTDPAKPGTVRLRLAWGDVTVTAADTQEVTIVSNIKNKHAAEKRADGLRRLDSEVTYSAAEKDNVISLEFSMDVAGSSHGNASVQLTVPRQTSIVVQSSFGGGVHVRDLVGDVEIRNMNGEITLDRISGAALVETMNGEIHATFLKVTEGKALSFTSMNGEVNVSIPADTKANVRLRTQNGAVYTDFDEKALVTHTEAAHGRLRHTHVRSAGKSDSDDDDEWQSDVRETVREAMRTGIEAAREAVAAAREAAQAAREGVAEANGAPIPPIPPMPPIMPSLSGGKVVSGALNGGGPDIQIATMNGTITLRKTQP